MNLEPQSSTVMERKDDQHEAYCVYFTLEFNETCLCLGREAILFSESE